MKLFAPSYYKKFKCIAGRCRHSCCIGWEIDVDEAAISRYEALGEVGKSILESIDYSGDAPHFRLCGERCPHLDRQGLCKIISERGKEYLCDICREHPRFYNFPSGRAEVGLGAACEEAARLILGCEDYADISAVGDTDGRERAPMEFDAVGEREKIYGILSDKAVPYPERLSKIYTEYNVSPLHLSDGEWRAVISELEYIDTDNKDRFTSYFSAASPEMSEYTERALAYFIYRHTASAEAREDFILSLGLSLFLERLFASLLEKYEADGPEDLLRIISEEIEYSEDNTERIKSEFLC